MAEASASACFLYGANTFGTEEEGAMARGQVPKSIPKKQTGKKKASKKRIVQGAGKRAECKLTVSLIVKNEEKNLPECLEAVRRLLDQVGGELIVTDTGSTDRTVEIAEEMADLVLHMEWKKDFAAARNFAIPYAKGEWLMYVDADEILDDDLSDAVSFFQSGEYRKYRSASIRQRNYIEESRSSLYSDFFAIRLWKIHPDLAFVGAVHEAVDYTPPVRRLNLVAHHFGYAGISDGKRQEKMLRNRELLKSQPENIRTLIQLADTYPTEIEKRIEIMERARKRVLDGVEAHEPWRLSTYMVLSREYYNNNDFDELRKLLEEYWSGKTVKYDLAGELDLRLLEGLLLLRGTDLEKTEEIFRECLRLYGRVEREELETPELHVTYVDAMRENNRYYFHIRMLALYHDRGLWEKMKEVFLLVPLSKVRKSGQVEVILQMAMNYVNQTEDVSVLVDCYRELLEEENAVKLGQFQRLLQIAFPLSSVMTEPVLERLVAVKAQEEKRGKKQGKGQEEKARGVEAGKRKKASQKASQEEEAQEKEIQKKDREAKHQEETYQEKRVQAETQGVETQADKFLSLCKLCLVSKQWEEFKDDSALRLEENTTRLDENQKRENREMTLRLLSEQTLQKEPYYLELFVLGMKLELEAEMLESHFPEEEMLSFIGTLSQNHKAFHVSLQKWLEGQLKREMISLKALQWCCYAASNGLFLFTETANVGGTNQKTVTNDPSGKKEAEKEVALDSAGRNQEAERGAVVFGYFQMLCYGVDLLNHRLYLPEVLREEFISVLPVLHQIGFYGTLALQAKAQGDHLEFLRNLKVIAQISPAMSGGVKVLSHQIEREIKEAEQKEQEKQDAAGKEFQALASQVKEQILTLISLERYSEAEEILTFYRNINPKDPQIGELAIQIQNRRGTELLN